MFANKLFHGLICAYVMETLIEICQYAVKTGYVRLAQLREVLAEDGSFSRQALEKIYADYACEPLSGIPFTEIIKHAETANTQSKNSIETILQGRPGADEQESDRQQKLFNELQNMALSGPNKPDDQPGDFLWRSSIWYWVLMRWAGIKHHYKEPVVNNADSLLALYFRTLSGDYQKIENKFDPNWHHYVSCRTLRPFFNPRTCLGPAFFCAKKTYQRSMPLAADPSMEENKTRSFSGTFICINLSKIPFPLIPVSCPANPVS